MTDEKKQRTGLAEKLNPKGNQTSFADKLRGKPAEKPKPKSFADKLRDKK